MKQIRLFKFGAFFMFAGILFSCDETEKVDLPTSVIIHYSVADKKVAFTALAHNSNSYSWDFGDGQTSTEPNPVHEYEDGGYYKVTLSVTGGTGTATDERQLAIALTPYVLLTGGPTAENGKTWRLAGSHSEFDYFANADATLSPFPGAPKPLSAGILGTGLGMGEVYLDEFTFHFDGRYEHDVKDDGAAFGGIVYQMVTTGGAGIVNSSGQSFGLCTGKYTPQAGATFTYVENENFTCSSVYGAGGAITFNNVSTLDFSGTEFVGFMDFQRKVIVQEVKDNTMRLVMFMAAGSNPASIIGINTHALILTFEAVR